LQLTALIASQCDFSNAKSGFQRPAASAWGLVEQVEAVKRLLSVYLDSTGLKAGVNESSGSEVRHHDAGTML